MISYRQANVQPSMPKIHDSKQGYAFE